MLIGCGAFVSLRRQTDMILMAHPAFTGTFFHSNLHGATPAFLLGRFFRLIGADISIFPNAGGRFSFTQEECNELSNELRMPDSNILPAFPAPAGGMRIERVSEMYDRYGKDTVFIIGGNLQQLSDDVNSYRYVFGSGKELFLCYKRDLINKGNSGGMEIHLELPSHFVISNECEKSSPGCYSGRYKKKKLVSPGGF